MVVETAKGNDVPIFVIWEHFLHISALLHVQQSMHNRMFPVFGKPCRNGFGVRPAPMHHSTDRGELNHCQQFHAWINRDLQHPGIATDGFRHFF